LAVKEICINNKKILINYEILNIKNRKNIIFLHGWGSNKEVMKSVFKNCFKDFKQIYIDLPGFGKSTNDYVLDSKDYAIIVEKFLNNLNIKKDIIVGHSFGGKVATLLKPDLLVLLSSAGILEKKPLNIKIKIYIFKLLKIFKIKKIKEFFVSKDAKGMSENMYETFKKVVNEDFSDIFKNYEKKALIFWGKEDRATSIESGKKINSLIKNSKFYSIEGDHYFFIKNFQFICEKIKEEYEKL